MTVERQKKTWVVVSATLRESSELGDFRRRRGCPVDVSLYPQCRWLLLAGGTCKAAGTATQRQALRIIYLCVQLPVQARQTKEHDMNRETTAAYIDMGSGYGYRGT